jgi:hypothetical protein
MAPKPAHVRDAGAANTRKSTKLITIPSQLIDDESRKKRPGRECSNRANRADGLYQAEKGKNTVNIKMVKPMNAQSALSRAATTLSKIEPHRY